MGAAVGRDILDSGALGLGILGAAGGAGAIAASLLVAALNGPTAMRNYVVFGAIGLGVFVIAFALSEVLVTSLVFALGAGFSTGYPSGIALRSHCT